MYRKDKEEEMKESSKIIREELKQMQDIPYKEFTCKLIPTKKKEEILGIRMPALRAYAKKLLKERKQESEEFLRDLPHRYFEEYNLHILLLEGEKDYEELILELEGVLPYVDNWATCDISSPKIFKKQGENLYEKALEWIDSDKTYTVRYGIGVLMEHFLDEKFREEMLDVVAEVKSKEYYVKMMQAWYFATALAKQYDKAISILERKRLDEFVQNKSIQKAIESRRVEESRKAYLRSLKY